MDEFLYSGWILAIGAAQLHKNGGHQMTNVDDRSAGCQSPTLVVAGALELAGGLREFLSLLRHRVINQASPN
jgi:hypothetical protein